MVNDIIYPPRVILHFVTTPQQEQALHLPYIIATTSPVLIDTCMQSTSDSSSRAASVSGNLECNN